MNEMGITWDEDVDSYATNTIPSSIHNEEIHF